MRSAAVSSAPDLAQQVTDLEAALAQTERAASLAGRIAAAEAELEAAASHFRAHGFTQLGVLPSERAHYERRAMIGALMAIAPAKLLESERARVTRVFEASGVPDLAPSQKAERLAELRRQLHAARARQELRWREQEAGGQQVDRSIGFSAPHFLAVNADLALAAAGEAA